MYTIFRGVASSRGRTARSASPHTAHSPHLRTYTYAYAETRSLTHMNVNE